ncbi:hypothetical protein SETIT_8G051200v2 [Setaria italica]|uniref:protein-serine/threonine phosphatase n=1 Tax=Setaria italica TaxID=4555 RepID=A0A368S4D5_SETIT|nr:hypothetical protein SETIT_8G051200v2 [Setaria italica]
MDNNMLPKIADFGMSRLFGQQQSRIITQKRVGTLGYMAPEYINNGLISYKSDIFSLGVIIIELLIGSRDYPQSSETSFEHVIENMRQRLRCVDSDPNKRPAAWDIIQMLNATESENMWSGINGGPLVDEIVRDRFANVKEKMQQPSILSCRLDIVDGEPVGMFGVYDGHNGAIAAEYVKEHLLRNLIEHPKFITDTKAAIAEAYNHTDSQFLKVDRSKPGPGAGSTAVTAIFRLCSRDHKPDQSDERHRIEDAGGFVMWDEGLRVGGVVPVSQAFDDKLLKQYVVADPEIKEVVVDSSLEFIILASNGLWQVVTNEGAVAIAKRHIWDPEESAKELLKEAYKRETSDNTTVVIVRFLHENSELPSI